MTCSLCAQKRYHIFQNSVGPGTRWEILKMVKILSNDSENWAAIDFKRDLEFRSKLNFY